jgi:hypothetical protein
MRQRDDPEYAQMLDRIRFGMPSLEDINKLNLKLIIRQKLSIHELTIFAVDKYSTIIEECNNCMCLFPKGDSVNDFNSCITLKNKIETIQIIAEDSNRTHNTFNTKDKDFKLIVTKKKFTKPLDWNLF